MMEALSPDPAAVFEVPAGTRIDLAHPSVLALPGGRLLAAVALTGPDVRSLPGQKGRFEESHHWVQGRVFASQDNGQTWLPKHEYAFGQGSLFRDGANVYLIGTRGAMQIMKSADGGETWSKPQALAPGGGRAGVYVESPCSVLHANGRLTVAVMQTVADIGRRVPTCTLAPVLLQAAEGTNLMSGRSWRWSEAGPTLDEALTGLTTDGFGLPFYEVPDPNRGLDIGGRRWANRPGWSQPHAVMLTDKRHTWRDPGGKTLHVLMSADTHRSNIAGLVRFEEGADGTLHAGLQPTPGGRRQLLLPLPGGHRRFHLLQDADSELYWLLSNQARDSMVRPERLDDARPGLPADHAPLLQLSFSTNLVDWCMAGWVAGGPGLALQDPAMDARGPDLFWACCAPDATAPDARHPKRLLVGLVPAFRGLRYGDA